MATRGSALTTASASQADPASKQPNCSVGATKPWQNQVQARADNPNQPKPFVLPAGYVDAAHLGPRDISAKTAAKAGEPLDVPPPGPALPPPSADYRARQQIYLQKAQEQGLFDKTTPDASRRRAALKRQILGE